MAGQARTDACLLWSPRPPLWRREWKTLKYAYQADMRTVLFTRSKQREDAVDHPHA